MRQRNVSIHQSITRTPTIRTGDWEQEGITGVFNRNCGITYSQYRNIFPLWALGRYAKVVERGETEGH